MVRNPVKKEEVPELPEAPEVPQAAPEEPARYIEREITLSLINDKLNYVTELLHKIAEAAEIDLNK